MSAAENHSDNRGDKMSGSQLDVAAGYAALIVQSRAITA
jgi:hypothetical protein